MEILDKQDKTYTVSMSIDEYTYIMELIKIIFETCYELEIPTLTGWNKSDLEEYLRNMEDELNKVYPK